MTQDESELREQAKASLKRKRDFKNFLMIYVVVNSLLIAIWALSGRGYFWPVWTLFGMGIALAFSAWDAFGSGAKSITDADVEAEMKRMKDDA